MKEKLRKYVEDMVRDIPKTRNVVDLKEEIIGNMEERYDDLRAEGYGEQDAFDCTSMPWATSGSLFEEGKQGKRRRKGRACNGGRKTRKEKRPYGEDPGSGSCPWSPAVSSGRRYGGSRVDRAIRRRRDP